MDSEQAAITLGINVEEVEDLAASIGADAEALSPEDLVEMASILDAEDEDDAEAD
jgi:hypothetical protein